MTLWIRDSLGILAEGAELSGALDPVAAVVLCGAHHADRMMIGGRWVVEDGMIPGLDIPGLIRRHNAAMHALHAG